LIHSADTIPPTGELVEPAPFSIITSNVMRVKVKAEDAESGVKEVRFFAELGGYVVMETLSLGSADKDPYQIVWDCRGVPDQNAGRIRLFAEIEDSAGNIARDVGRSPDPFIAIDRNPHLQPITLRSYFAENSIEIDGWLKEWQLEDPIHFSSNNDIQVFSEWDNEKLYFAYRIRDKYLYAEKVTKKRFRFENNPNYYLALWENDGVEISLDLLHDHNILRREDDIEIIISIDGVFQANKRDVRKQSLNVWTEGIRCSVLCHGTVNNNEDTDSGYTVEISIPWSALGIEPGHGKTIGFDAFNVDHTQKGDLAVWISWSGIVTANNDNPSEWGNLLLVKRSKGILPFKAILILILVIMILAVVLIVLRKNRNKPPRTAESRIITRDQTALLEIKKYLESHFYEELKPGQVAEQARISESKLRSLFSKEAGTNFTQYVLDMRLEKAEEMLRTTDVFIIDIAMKVGFKDPKYFSRVFKKKYGVTPQEFRERAQKE
jgi:AraC-like DNA-binding protein